MPHRLVVWDFDGVLNANVVDGRFVWAETLQRDLGVDPVAFSRDLFGSSAIKDVMCGRIDLLDYLSGWLKHHGHDLRAERFLDYWFEKDRHPDPEVLLWLKTHPGRAVIGTNNERRRASFIENEMGFGDSVERIFSSGQMGASKPDDRFFEQIETWSGVAQNEIALIDDTAANIEACRRRGWQGFHFTADTRADLPAFLELA